MARVIWFRLAPPVPGLGEGLWQEAHVADMYDDDKQKPEDERTDEVERRRREDERKREPRPGDRAPGRPSGGGGGRKSNR
jgi:hypothetical protein